MREASAAKADVWPTFDNYATHVHLPVGFASQPAHKTVPVAKKYYPDEAEAQRQLFAWCFGTGPLPSFMYSTPDPYQAIVKRDPSLRQYRVYRDPLALLA